MLETPLTSTERDNGGFTHRFQFTFADLNNTTSGQKQTILLKTLSIGDLVEETALVVTTTLANSADGTNNTTTASVGDAESDTQFQTASETNANGTYVAYKAGTNAAGKAYTAADALNLVITPKSGTALSVINTGAITVLARIVRLPALA
jgi:hypothetical protein